jgi:hypothetical protein
MFGGNPTNLDALPTVIINGDSLLTPQVNHITKGVYSVDVLVSSLSGMVNTIWTDEWSGIIINGVNRPNITLDFVLKDSIEYYSLGSADLLPKKVAISVGIIKKKIKRGDIRKVIVSARIPYTVEQTQIISGLKYRLYVSEGSAELTVIDMEPIEMTNNHYYFLLDTDSLIPILII